MECPWCKANGGVWKKEIGEDGIPYYRCSACHHENHHIEIQRKQLEKKEQEE